MHDYIILNDISSKSINGLLIQQLPPISKPAIRIKTEEIDGRDGDIVTKLGYSAYDKQVQIGLFGGFDIDEVIEFFNSDGIVTFSNETDKYYKYQILKQVDYEKLLRFRTAIVTFHVQPFKYSNIEKEKEYNITNEDSIIIRNNGNYYSRPVVTLYGNGTINLSLNEEQLFVIDLSDETEITLDFDTMNAYNKETNVFKNRLVTGNYDNFKLKVGKNTISWTGSISKIEIENYSRWI